jgi:glycosyltransferase involved in cell wall biosynthesis
VPRSAAPIVATTFCKRELACVRALRESVAEHEPGARLVAVLLDDPDEVVADDEPFEILRPERLLPADAVAELAQHDDPALLADAVRGPVVELLSGAEVWWLPPDGMVTAPFDPDAPERGWVRPGSEPAYLRTLARHGHASLEGIPFGRGLLGRSDYIGDLARSALVDQRAARPPDAQEPDDVVTWLRTSVPLLPGAGHGVNRFLAALWDVRPDLQAQFPDLDGDDGPLLIEWAWRWGVVNDHLPAHVLPPRPDPSVLTRPVDAPPRPSHPDGVNVVGLLERELGLGEAARHLVAALDAVGVPVLPIEARSIVSPVRPSAAGYALDARDAVHDITILCLNGPMIDVFVDEAGSEFFTRRFTVAVWFWEVGAPPPSWFDHAHLLDEIWVATAFMADALRPVAPVPVVVMPQAVEAHAAAPLDWGGFGVDPEAFVFLYMFDHSSDLKRKNPEGLIAAYIDAFPDDGKTALVLKSLNAHKHPANRDLLRVAASRRSDIHVIDEQMEPGDRDALVAACDCYVSLHRSEGFGLTLAEAMLHGRPVIATRYGGTLEFMDDANSLLVDVQPTAVGPGSVYPGDGTWAEPDLDHAARCMRAAVADPAAARTRAATAKADVLARHSPAAVGQRLRTEITRIHSLLDERGSPAKLPEGRRRAAEAAGLALAEARRHRARVAELEVQIRTLGGTPSS